MKTPFLFVLLALCAALLVCSDVQAGCQQQVLALRQVQVQQVQQYYAPVQVQQLNDGCYVQQQLQQVQHVQRVQQIRVQQLNQHHNQQQLLIVRPQRQQQQVIIQRQALFPRLFGR